MSEQAEDSTKFEDENQASAMIADDDNAKLEIETADNDHNADADPMMESGTCSSPTANVIASAGMDLLPDKDFSFLTLELNKRQRCNAKAVEWLSMDGTHFGQFRSGFEAAKTLNLTQGDISLCCRGMRHQVGGFKFRFVDVEARPETRLKRGFSLETPEGEGSRDQLADTRRTTRRQGEFGVAGGEIPVIMVPKTNVKTAIILAPAELKVRKWRKVLLKLGNLKIPKWVPDQDQPTFGMQDFLPKRDLNKGKKRKSILVGRGSTAHEILGDYED